MKFVVLKSNLSPSSLKEDPQMLKFYKGIPDWTVFMALYDLVRHAIPTTFMNKLSKFSMVLMFLIKIRCNLLDEDLGSWFGVHKNFSQDVEHNVHPSVSSN